MDCEALEEAEPEADTEEQRADFLTHLGAALQAGHGYAAAGVDEALRRARAQWQATGDDRLSAVIRGQWMFHLVRRVSTTRPTSWPRRC